jgi:hypothetical protein
LAQVGYSSAFRPPLPDDNGLAIKTLRIPIPWMKLTNVSYPQFSGS